jgi:hypothetical protein
MWWSLPLCRLRVQAHVVAPLVWVWEQPSSGLTSLTVILGTSRSVVVCVTLPQQGGV